MDLIRATLVVGSVQSMCRKARLHRFAPDTFTLVVVDEAHHAIAPTYRRILDYVAPAKVLGVTATPDRGDALAMEVVFESVAYTYDIQDGIRDRILKPVDTKVVTVGAIDLAGVKTVAGDFNQGQLDAVMGSEEALHGIVKPTLEMAGDRRTIVFTTSIDNAHRMAEIFNRYRSGCARAVDGTTELGTRRSTLSGHKGGDYQFLCNVGVLTEGYDDPGVSCIVMGRPTKSRALAAQMIGRGLRPEDGVRVRDDETCLVLDFKGTHRHALTVSAINVLAGRWPEDVIERAKDDAAKAPANKPPQSVEAALKAAAAAIKAEEDAARAKRERIKASKVEYHATSIDPFRVMGVSGGDEDQDDGKGRPATPGQIDQLHKFGMDVPTGLTTAKASKLIGTAIMRMRNGLASYKQLKLLDKYGVNGRQMYFRTASRVIDAISQNNWRALSPDQLSRAVGAREVGEDG